LSSRSSPADPIGSYRPSGLDNLRKQRERQRPETGTDLKDHVARAHPGKGGDLPYGPLLDNEVLPELLGRPDAEPARYAPDVPRTE
jgi:hypothetical protein